MKKIILIIFLLMAFVVNAQIEFRPGIKAGFSSSNISNGFFGVDSQAKNDFYFGAFGTVKFVHFYHLQPEIIYSRQGFKFNLSEFIDVTLGENKVNLDYLSITMANKFYPFKNIGLHAIVGPSFDILLKDEVESSANTNVINDFGFEGFDFALIGGLGYDFSFGLGIEARFKHGFVDIFGQNFNDSVSFDELLANQVFQIGATYQFDF